MNIEKVIQEDRQAKLTVTYSPEEFQGFKRRAAKKISSNAKIPGFRPGKVPYQVIVNKYGEDAIVQEAIEILIETDYSKILEEAELEPSGAGNLDAIETYDPPILVLYVPLEPEVDLADYRQIRIDFKPEDFDVTEVDRYIMNLRRNSASIVPAERPAEVEDLVYFNLSGEFLNLDSDEETTIADKTPQQVVIPSEDEQTDNEWPYPGFSRSLLGVSAGDVKEIQYTYPDDFSDEEYQGKTAIFTVDVQSVKALELPEIDDAFVQSMGNFETPEDFKTALEEQMRSDHEEAYEQAFFNQVLAEVLEQSTINYPPQMLEHEEEHVLDDIKARLEKQNIDFETFLKLRNIDEKTFIESEVEPAAKQRLERSLVLDTLVEAEGLKLDEELYHQTINDVVGEVLRGGNFEELKKQMSEEQFTRVISMEGFSRAMNTQLRKRMKLIATGQPIPEDTEEPEPILEVDTKVGERDNDTTTDGDLEEKLTDDLIEPIAEISSSVSDVDSLETNAERVESDDLDPNADETTSSSEDESQDSEVLDAEA